MLLDVLYYNCFFRSITCFLFTCLEFTKNFILLWICPDFIVFTGCGGNDVID
jgi:hypothetical protein